MAATLFTELYDYVRVATGNEDPTVGVETLPDTRIDVLLRSAALTLPSYSESFQQLVVDTSGSPFTVAAVTAPTTPLDVPHIIGLVHAAAHKYFVGIGNKLGVTESLGALEKAAEAVSGYTNLGVTEQDLQAALIYKQRKQREALAQTNLR